MARAWVPCARSWERLPSVRLSRREGELNMKRSHIALALVLALPCAAFAAGGGGGSSAGGGASGTGSAVGSPSAGSAGAGTLGTSGVPSGPANVGGLNNTSTVPNGGTVGMARSNLQSGGVRGDQSGTVNETPPGTNGLGTAESSGGTAAAPGVATSTVTSEQDSDAKIDEENRRLDRTVMNICRGC